MSKYIKLNIYTESNNIGGYDPRDSWSRDSFEYVNTIHSEFTLSKTFSLNNILTKIDIKPNTDYYLLYAEYTTGDSFGHESGNLDLIEVYESYNDALIQKYAIETDYKIYRKKGNSKLEIELNDKEKLAIGCPWKVYFESLDNVEIATIRLKNEL